MPRPQYTYVMRLLRLSVGKDIHFGVVEDGSSKVVALKGDPLFAPVEPSGPIFDLSEVDLLAPVIPRSKVVIVSQDGVTLKPNTSVVSHSEPVVPLREGKQLSVRPTVAAVVRTLSKDLSAEAADKAVLGTLLLGDYRDEFEGNQYSLFDTSTPLGPWMRVGDQPRTFTVQFPGSQYELASDRIFEAVQRASQLCTLLPGDVVAWEGPVCEVKSGDVVTLTASALGSLENRIISTKEVFNE